LFFVIKDITKYFKIKIGWPSCIGKTNFKPGQSLNTAAIEIRFGFCLYGQPCLTERLA
jgi:hypothetical protein